ncbi:MAG: ribonuclease HII [Ruminococcaceae bacterium]|nr:ribonuclease HII [Oscillospiraceae bacterium]
MLDYSFDASHKTEAIKIICGVDEAGRGPLAGPVVAAACILPDGLIIDGLDDSKKLTEKKREKIFDVILEKALDYSIASASVEEIEEINILNAAMLAMKRAIDGLEMKPDLALIDGNMSRGFDVPTKTVVHGDAISQSIAAASILAKVTRDRLCYEYDKEYPEYGFAKHKGYGTKLHTDAIKQFGITPIHRPSFLVKLLKND